MTAILANRPGTAEMLVIDGISPFCFPVAATTTLYAGTIGCIDTAGNAVPATLTTGLKVVGCVQKLADNSAGLAGAISVEMKAGVFHFLNYASDLIADTERGETCYVHDNQTVRKTSASGTTSVAGTVIDVDSTGVWVGMGFEFMLAPEAADGLSDNTPVEVNGTAGAAGIALGFSRDDHVHFHGAQTVGTLHAASTSTVNGFQSFLHKNYQNASALCLQARGVVIANQATLSAFVVSNNGVTYVAGDRVLLAGQTTGSENGLYVVGTVSGTAPLTRDPAMIAASSYVKGCTIEVSEGTLFAGSTWKAMATGTCTVGTHDPLFYPRVVKGILTLSSGTYTLGVTEGLYLFSTTTSTINCTMNTPGGTLTLTTGGYGSNSAGRSAGKSGTGAAIVIARVAAGTIDTANNSTVDFLVTNW